MKKLTKKEIENIISTLEESGVEYVTLKNMIFTLKGANRIYKINNTIYVMWIVYNAEKAKIYEISLSKLTLNLRTVGVEDIPELKEEIKEFIETVFY